MQCWKEKENRLGISGSMKPCGLSRIIYEDEQVIVYHKPAGLATQSAKVGQADVVSELKKYLVRTAPREKPGTEPYLGVVHRLDQPVEGILVFAKTKAAAAQLTKQLEIGTLNKKYYALVCGKPKPESGELVDYLVKEGNVARVVSPDTPGARKAVLQYKVLQSKTDTFAAENSGAEDTPVVSEPTHYISCLDVHIETGRFHQIRVQLAHRGWPILGDSKYGTPWSQEKSRQQGIRNVALFAYELTFVHPKTGKKCEYNILEKAPY